MCPPQPRLCPSLRLTFTVFVLFSCLVGLCFAFAPAAHAQVSPPSLGPAVNSGNGCVNLTWTNGQWETWIFRSDNGGAFQYQAKTFGGDKTDWPDVYTVNGHTYSYYLVAIGPGDVPSNPSNTASLLVDLDAPSLTLTRSSSDWVQLNWNPVYDSLTGPQGQAFSDWTQRFVTPRAFFFWNESFQDAFTVSAQSHIR